MKALFLSPTPAGENLEDIMWLRGQEMIRVLGELGVEVMTVDVAHASAGEFDTRRQIERFAPDFVFAPNFNYYLRVISHSGSVLSDGPWPVYAGWDDPLGALQQCVRERFTLQERAAPPPAGALQRIGVRCRPVAERLLRGIRRRLQIPEPFQPIRPLEEFRALMDRAELRHLAWDSGHAQAVTELALTQSDRITWYPLATFEPFLAAGRRRERPEEVRDLAFCGNLYSGRVLSSPYWRYSFFVEMIQRISQARLADLSLNAWELLNRELEGASRKERAEWGLYPHLIAFWDLYIFVTWVAENSLSRLGVLSRIPRPVDVFGVFEDPESRDVLETIPNLRFAGHAHHFDELPEAYASTRVNVCIANGLIQRGAPSKLIDCLASGGFALSDPKEDLVRIFGEKIRAIFFRTPDELNAKIEYYLARPKERRDIAEDLRETTARVCTLESFFGLILNSLAGSPSTALRGIAA